MQSATHASESYSKECQYPPQVYHSERRDGYSRSPQPVGENALYYGTAAPSSNQGYSGPEDEGERGLGSTLLGGAGGAYIGHQMGGGMATPGGAVIGALEANAVTHSLGYYQQQQQQYQQYQQYQPQGYQQTPYPPQGYQQPLPGTTMTTTTTTTTDNSVGVWIFWPPYFTPWAPCRAARSLASPSLSSLSLKGVQFLAQAAWNIRVAEFVLRF
ncbi:hypothetical protein N7486_008139 [Penicillium sp. IBT 16267x]|nr:hypothetical protein N7486_008139 [Penicillium sp. IBT 16267x]